MKKSRSSIVDADEPWTLDEHASDILNQWRHLKSTKGNSEHAIRVRTLKLIDAYEQANRLLPPQMYQLLREIIQPPRRRSFSSVRKETSERYMAAVRFEAENPGATKYAVAKFLCEFTGEPDKRKTFEHQVEEWRKRKKNHYQSNIEQYRKAREKGLLVVE